MKAELSNMPDESLGLSYSMDSDVSVQYLQEDGGVIVNGEYEVAVRQGDIEPDLEGGDEDTRTVILNLEFNMAALFAVDVPSEAEALTEDEIDAFARTTGQFALHPYAREFVANLTGRMGLPPLHIGMMKLHLDGPDEVLAVD